MTAKKTPDTTEVKEAPENNDCFIIMPIADHKDYKDGHFKRVYEDILAPACRAAGYKPVRADDVAQTNLIHLDILQKLLDSPMAICDLSTRNPNVLFELGLRQAFDKPTVLVQEIGTPQIFDINLFRYTEYRNGLDYRDVLADQQSIQKVLEETKLAVQENRSVNSIIKLLSIMEPAKLQDVSNFGEQELFKILMSELQSIKSEISLNSPQNNRALTPRGGGVPRQTKYDPGSMYEKIYNLKDDITSLFEDDPVKNYHKILELIEMIELDIGEFVETYKLSDSLKKKMVELLKQMTNIKSEVILGPEALS